MRDKCIQWIPDRKKCMLIWPDKCIRYKGGYDYYFPAKNNSTVRVYGFDVWGE